MENVRNYIMVMLMPKKMAKESTIQFRQNTPFHLFNKKMKKLTIYLLFLCMLTS